MQKAGEDLENLVFRIIKIVLKISLLMLYNILKSQSSVPSCLKSATDCLNGCSGPSFNFFKEGYHRQLTI